jgi:hypothetical protein
MVADHQGGRHQGGMILCGPLAVGLGHPRRIDGAGAVSGPPPIATYRRAAIRAAVRINGPEPTTPKPR